MQDCYLEPAGLSDVAALHGLCCLPDVYRFLFDGSPPDRTLVTERIERSVAGRERHGFGLWLLRHPEYPVAGAVDIADGAASRSRTLTYLLHPGLWGRGLAFRMAASAVCKAFEDPDVDLVIADADGENAASRVIIERLGMSFRRVTDFPLGPGVEYGIARCDWGPDPVPALLEMRGILPAFDCFPVRIGGQFPPTGSLSA